MAVKAQERADLANELLEQIGQTVGQKATVSSVFGEPIEREGLTVIPVAKARFGFGGGGGALVSPIGYIELHDGSAEFRRISTPMDFLALVAAASVIAVAVKRLFD